MVRKCAEDAPAGKLAHLPQYANVWPSVWQLRRQRLTSDLRSGSCAAKG